MVTHFGMSEDVNQAVYESERQAYMGDAFGTTHNRGDDLVVGRYSSLGRFHRELANGDRQAERLDPAARHADWLNSKVQEMSFKTILMTVDVATGDRDICIAVKLCKDSSAHLSIVVVSLAASPPVGNFTSMASDAWITRREGDLDNLVRREMAIIERVGNSGLPHDVTAEYCDARNVDDIIGLHARYSDLTVVGPELLAGGVLRNKVLEGALFSSGRPLMMIPEGAKASLTPKQIVVAWNGRLEALRAVREAIDMIGKADSVHVVMVDPYEDNWVGDDEPGEELSAYLERHNAKVIVKILPSSGRSVVDAINQYALDQDADLVVMGCYGHSRMRERIFGGATREMLANLQLPTLMAR